MEGTDGSFKCEIEPDGVFATRPEARATILEYLEVFYNRVRLHSSLGFLSPAEFERVYRQTYH